MKLLVCATEYYPYGSGIANVAYNVVEKLKERGIKCTVCSPTGPDIKLGSTKLIKKYGIFGLIHYWREVSNYFVKNADDFDVVWCHNPFFLNNNPFEHCLVTMNSTYYGNAMSSSYPFNIKMYKKIVSYIEKYSLTHLDSNTRFTGVGNNVCEELELMGIEKNRISFIPNGVDTNNFKPTDEKEEIRKKYNIPENHLMLLSVGRLTEAKAPLRLIDTFNYINEKIDFITLVIAGNGELANKVKQYRDEKGLKNVILLGNVKAKDTPQLYACSDYFIMTSRYEGGEPPLTLSEAMASGLPCIVSNISNFNVVDKANCGIMVDFGDLKEAGKEVVGYLERDNSEHSTNAREYAENNLDWDMIADKYIEEFIQLSKHTQLDESQMY
ncbi:MAG: group 1 glycosyl transferase [Methanohalophilus sp.]|nr:MAG: group 1 glycosyl transferase [Methanohalophilus sp.]